MKLTILEMIAICHCVGYVTFFALVVDRGAKYRERREEGDAR